ncbi:MAG: hypothetical protein K0B87_07305 [Candidatus Syntrophosphaera sp.]|nr:hypothetical protein [Candidatus Syntrophosphaera sp.]
MSNRHRLSLLAMACLAALSNLGAQDGQVSVNNSFTAQNHVFLASELPDAEISVSWKPELFGEYFISPAIRLSADLSMTNHLNLLFDGDGSGQELDFSMYRAWLAASYRNTELKGGLQHIRMGVAQVLRPLMWFDRIVPGAMLQETKGVQALTLTHFFPDPELRLWLLRGNGEAKGAELLPSQQDSWEFGGRIGAMTALGETGLSYHQRVISHPQTSAGVTEYRIGFDQRVDGFMGGWLEAAANLLENGVSVATPYGSYAYPRQIVSLTLGGDYTIEVGNGLYLLLEQNMQLQGLEPVKDTDARFNGALLMTYPLGLLDGLQMLASYDYNERRGFGAISWRRTYDYLSWELSLGLDSGYPAHLSRMPSLNLVLNYDI